MIDFPDYPGPQSAKPGLIDFGVTLTPPLGARVQRVDRMGNRWKLSVTMPPLSGSEGRIWVARLIKGQSEGARMEFPLLDFDPGLPGLPLVSGSGQTGRNLAIKSARPNYIYREGQFISVLTGGAHYLMMVDSEVRVAADGTATLPISPMLRVPHLDNDPVHVAKPMIEGLIQGNEREWDMQIGHFQSLSFDIVESA